MTTNNIAIKTNELTKSFGQRVAVKNLNIEIRKGEIFSLLGTNGAGKTTTIKMLSCLIPPTSGNASLLGFETNKNPLRIKNRIGVSPQETAIAAHLNSMENLMLMGGIFGLKKNDSKIRAIKLMKLMELENRKDQSRKLSGGLQRRLSIAMAMMSDPEILFLDEPTLGLDPHARKSVWKYIEKLKQEKTILLTTHYLEEADALADHIAIMDKGVIIESGTPDELKSRNTNKHTLSISADKILEEAVTHLKSKNLEVVKVNGGIEISSADLNINMVLDIIREHDIQIKSIQTYQPTLDDVFLKLTEKEDKR